jgi:serine/threonine protein kinase
MVEICEAVQLINKAGFIHCDLKLENIMIEFNKGDVPTVKIIDFGSTFELEYGLPKIVNIKLFRQLPRNTCPLNY